MSNTQIAPEKIHMEGIRILKSHFEVDISTGEEERDVSSYGIGLKSDTVFNHNENRVRFRLFLKIQGYNDVKEVLGIKGEYHIDFFYHIENLQDFVTWEEDKFKVEAILGGTLAGISYSTCRGIILGRTETTDFNGVILPVINPNLLLEEDTFSEM